MSHSVTIYSTQTCHFCHLAKDFFKENNVAYTEHDVGTDLDKRKEMVDLSKQMGVPVIKIDNDFVVGFDQSRIQSMLGM